MTKQNPTKAQLMAELSQLRYRVTELEAAADKQRQTEKALRESETRYRLLTENVSGVLWILDLNIGRFRYVSPAVERLRGYTVAEIMAQDMLAALTPRSRQYLEQVLPQRMADFKQGRRYAYTDEIEQPCRDGTTVWTEVTTHYHINEADGHLHIYGVSHNITKCKRMEKTLKESESRLREAQQLAHLGSWEWDMAQQTLTWSDEVYRIFGLEPGAFQPSVEAFEAAIHPADKVDFLRQRAEMLDQHQAACIDHRIVMPNGEVRYVQERSQLILDEAGALCRVIGTVQDITERKRAEEALGESEMRFRLLAENSTDMISRHDTQGNYLYVSPACRTLLGYNPEELLGHSAFECIHPDDVPTVAISRSKIIEQPIVSTTLYRIRHKNGDYVWLETTSCAILDKETGEVVEIHAATRDVSGRKQVEEALRDSESRYHLLFKEMITGFAVHEIICDEKGEPVNYRFLSVNTVFETLTGLHAADIVGKTVLEVMPETEREWIERYGHVALTGEPVQFENYSAVLGKYYEVRTYSPEWGKFAVLFHDITERKQAEKELKNRTATLNSVFESAPYIMMLVNREGRVEEINRSGVLFAGRSKDQLMGLLGGEVFSCLNSFNGLGCGRNAVCQHCSVRTRVTRTFETSEPIYSAEGQLTVLQAGRPVKLDLLISTAKIEDADKVLVTIADITERKQAEKALRESDARATAMFNAIPDLMFRLDRQGVFLDYKADITDLYVQTEPTIIGKRNRDLAPPEFADLIERQIQVTLETGALQTFEYQLSIAGRGVRDYEARMAAIGPDEVTAIVRDITERKRVEEALRESEERFALFMDYLPAVVFIKDEESRTLYVNKYMKDVLGAKDWIGKTSRELFPKDIAEAMIADDKKTLAIGYQVIVETVPDKHGTNHIYNTYKFSIKRSGKPPLLGAIALNITERIRAEESLRQSNQRLEETLAELKETQHQMMQRERLAAVGQLAAGIAHDFNNILTGIIGFASLLQMSPDTSEAVRADLKHISTAGERAAHLVRQILDFSRKSIHQPRQFDLASFTKEGVKFWERTIPENIHLSLHIEPGDYRLKADPTQIQQALTNLVVNARDAMPTGGQLQLNLARATLQGKEQCVDCFQPIEGDWFCLTVADTGTGISAEVLSHIFEPFFTTKTVGEGSGLGLAQVLGIVQQHAGHLRVDSQRGQGTSFTLYLPPAILSQAVSAPAQPDSLVEGHGETILVVEDEPMVLAANKAMLRHLGYHTLTAQTGREALAVYTAHQAEIALVLSDMMMPDMTGTTLLDRLKAQNPDIKMVIMSGYPLEENGANLLAQGVVDWFQKPISFEEFAKVISRNLPG